MATLVVNKKLTPQRTVFSFLVRHPAELSDTSQLLFLSFSLTGQSNTLK